MQQALAALLPASRRRESLARALALVVDGSIVQAQFRPDLDEAVDHVLAVWAIGQDLVQLGGHFFGGEVVLN